MEFKDYFFFIIKLITFSGALLLLLVALLKKGEGKVKKLTNGKYVSIIEKTYVGKNQYIYVLKLGQDGAVFMSTEKGMDKIKDLTKEEVQEIEANKNKSNEEMKVKYTEGISSFRNIGSKFLKKLRRQNEE